MTKPTKLPRLQFGKLKTGIIGTNWGRDRLVYTVKDHHAGTQKITLDPTTVTARIETAEEASKHMKAGRVGGGLVAGAILLGPLGAAIGGGLGAAARKSYTDKYLTLETEGGDIYSALLKGRIDYLAAQELVKAVDAFRPHTTA